MNVLAKFDEIPSKILQDIKETKPYRHTQGRTDVQHENSIPTHKHSLREGVLKESLHFLDEKFPNLTQMH